MQKKDIKAYYKNGINSFYTYCKHIEYLLISKKNVNCAKKNFGNLFICHLTDEPLVIFVWHFVGIFFTFLVVKKLLNSSIPLLLLAEITIS